MACGPTWDTVPNGDGGYAGTRPKLGLNPTLPQNAAGTRIDPAPSVPMPSGPSPAATAAAVPPDDPPGVLAVSHGLRVSPVRGELVSALQPNSGVAVLPISTAPASRRRAVAGASTSHGCSGSTVRLPRRVGQPRVRTRSLIEVGTPSSGPIGSPRCHRASLPVADTIASSAATRQNALSTGFSSSIASSTAAVASTGDASRRAYRPRSSSAVHCVRFTAAVCPARATDGRCRRRRSRRGHRPRRARCVPSSRAPVPAACSADRSPHLG